jgi:hypothetical protein
MSTTVQAAIEAFRRLPPVQRDDPYEEKASLDVKMHFRNLCAFDLTGPMATDAIKACLKPVDKQGEVFKKASRLFQFYEK